METAGPKSDRESNFSGSQQKSLCFCSRNNVTIIFFPTESGNYDFSEKKRNYGARRIFYDRRIFYEAQRMAVVLPLTPPKKNEKIDFIQNLPNVTPIVRGGKEPEFKSFPGLKRVLTLSGGKFSKNRFLSFCFWP